jgi:hypothetical protein
MKFRIESAAAAKADIQRQGQWLCNEASPAAANKWLAGLYKAIDTLQTRPLRCRVFAEKDKFPGTETGTRDGSWDGNWDGTETGTQTVFDGSRILMALRDSRSPAVFAAGRNAIPFYDKMPPRSKSGRPKFTQLHSGREKSSADFRVLGVQSSWSSARY